MALELTDTTIEHRGLVYTLSGGPEEWVIGRDGALLGYLVVKSPAGEEGEPVYTTRLPDGAAGDLEGTDWDQIVKGLVNVVDPAIADATSNVPRAGG
jgi:hypothetical protein